jgi:hypothetical protein
MESMLIVAIIEEVGSRQKGIHCEMLIFCVLEERGLYSSLRAAFS